MLQGFTIPLLIGLGSEFIWGFNLLLPFPLNQPGILLARLTYTPYVSRVQRCCCYMRQAVIAGCSG